MKLRPVPSDPEKMNPIQRRKYDEQQEAYRRRQREAIDNSETVEGRLKEIEAGKVKDYLTDAQRNNKIESLLQNKDEVKKRFTRLAENPKDPIGEGKFEDWTEDDFRNAIWVLFREDDRELPPHSEM